jgi:hypothetical protein
MDRLMFEALVLVCMINNHSLCHTLQDLEGPYKTEQECIARTHEMAADLPEYMPEFEALKYKCLKKDSPKGKVNIYYGRDKEKETQKHWHEGSYHQRWTQKTY